MSFQFDYYIHQNYTAGDVFVVNEELGVSYKIIGRILESYLSNRFAHNQQFLKDMYPKLKETCGKRKEYCKSLIRLEDLLKGLDSIVVGD